MVKQILLRLWGVGGVLCCAGCVNPFCACTDGHQECFIQTVLNPDYAARAAVGDDASRYVSYDVCITYPPECDCGWAEIFFGE